MIGPRPASDQTVAGLDSAPKAAINSESHLLRSSQSDEGTMLLIRIGTALVSVVLAATLLGISAEARGDAEATVGAKVTPTESEHKASAAAVKQIFKEDFALARTSPQKSDLARKLLESAMREGTSPADCHALLSMTKDLAIEAGDVPIGLEALSLLASEFPSDADSVMTKSLPRLLRVFPKDGNAVPVIENLLALVDEAIDDNRYDLAKSILTQSQLLAARTKEAELAARLTAQLSELRRTEQLAGAFAAAQENLAKNPDDAGAHLVVGKFLCFVNGDWEAGLKHLAAGDDAALAGLATREISPEANAEQVAEGWWNVGEKEQGANRDQILAHAAEWYRKAGDSLTGLAKARAEKRIEQVEKSAEASEATKARSSGPGSKATASAWWTAPDKPRGLAWIPRDESRYTSEKHDGKAAVLSSMYYYFNVDDAFAFDLPKETDERVFVKVRFFDEAPSMFDVMYDGYPWPGEPDPKKYWQKSTDVIGGSGSGQWVEDKSELLWPRLAGRLHDKADIRLDGKQPVQAIGAVAIERVKIRPIGQRTMNPGATVDLMPLIDPAVDVMSRNWQRVQAAIVNDPRLPSGLMLPVIPYGDYQVSLNFRRLGGGKEVLVSLPVKRRRVNLSIDWAGGKASGLSRVKGMQMHDDGNPTRIKGKQLVDGRPATLVIRVALRGDDVTITSQLDGKPGVQWSGPVSDLEHGNNTPWPGAIGIHADKDCPLEILGAKLEVLSGTAMLLH